MFGEAVLVTKNHWTATVTLVLILGLSMGCGSDGSSSISKCLTDSDLSSGAVTDAKYDRSENVTQIGVVPSVKGLVEEPYSVSLGLFVSCTGKGACKPDVVRVAFVQQGGPKSTTEVVEAIFLVDGEQRIKTVTSGGVTGLEALKSAGSMGGRVVQVPYDDFVQIACADTVEYRIGTVEGSLGAEQRDGLKYLVSIVENELSLTELQTSYLFGP